MMRFSIALVAVLASVAVANASEPYVSKLKGKYDLWEDFEGGKVCKVTLAPDATIGGFVFKGDDRCMTTFKFTGDPQSWFVDKEGWLVILDATRKTLARFKPGKDGSFYANRTADGLENLNLTRP